MNSREREKKSCYVTYAEQISIVPLTCKHFYFFTTNTFLLIWVLHNESNWSDLVHYGIGDWWKCISATCRRNKSASPTVSKMVHQCMYSSPKGNGSIYNHGLLVVISSYGFAFATKSLSKFQTAFSIPYSKNPPNNIKTFTTFYDYLLCRNEYGLIQYIRKIGSSRYQILN